MVPCWGCKCRFGFSDFTLITGLNPGIENDFVKDIPSDRRMKFCFHCLDTRRNGKGICCDVSRRVPEDLSYPLDEETVPTDDREMVEETARERDRHIERVRAYKCRRCFFSYERKDQELDRKIYALDQKLEARSHLYTWFTREASDGDGISPIMGQWWRQRRPRVVVEEEEHDQVVEDPVRISRGRSFEEEEDRMQRRPRGGGGAGKHGDDREREIYKEGKRPSKHVEKENVLQTGVKRKRVPSIHTRTPFTINRATNNHLEPFWTRCKLISSSGGSIEGQKFKEWYTNAVIDVDLAMTLLRGDRQDIPVSFGKYTRAILDGTSEKSIYDGGVMCFEDVVGDVIILKPSRPKLSFFNAFLYK
ncbi:hypothetical protein DH2020_034538 [Rehmannia glutinosa]|uniref:Uncharacterized protein n=1 Tax=Rehmannia glutinosa TaxID=99300 RepID=A0ABR0VC73_REHGL